MTKKVDTAAAKKGTPAEKAAKATMLHDRATKSTHLDPTHSSIAPLKAKSEALKDMEKEKESAKKVWQSKVKAARTATKDLEDAIDDYGDYVDDVADGSEEIINDCGLTMRQKAEPVTALDMVTGIVVENGKESGHVLVSFDRVVNANHYEILVSISPSDENSYRIVKTTPYTTDVDVSGFRRGDTVAIKVRAIGRKNIASPLQQSPVTRYVS